MSDSEKKPGFTVNDRRSFSDGGESRSEPAAPAPTAAPAAAPAPEAPPPSGEATRQARGGREFPPVDFSTFVLSLGSSALIHLGEMEPPGETAPHRDLPMAKHTIDLLTMMQEKTRSNLTPEEDKLLDSLLYDLRLRYVEALKAGS
jgi:hypothetical protein